MGLLPALRASNLAFCQASLPDASMVQRGRLSLFFRVYMIWSLSWSSWASYSMTLGSTVFWVIEPW